MVTMVYNYTVQYHFQGNLKKKLYNVVLLMEFYQLDNADCGHNLFTATQIIVHEDQFERYSSHEICHFFLLNVLISPGFTA